MFEIGCLVFSIICCVSIIQYTKKKYKKQFLQLKKTIEENYLQTRKEELNIALQQELQEKQRKAQNLQEQIENLQSTFEHYEKSLKKGIDQHLDEYKEQSLKNIDLLVQHTKEKEMTSLYNEINNQKIVFQAQFDEEAELLHNDLALKKKELEILKENIKDFQHKQEAINSEIRRRRELEEKENFYRICLRPEAIGDITVLQQARQNLKKPEIIDKIIYDNYVAKPVLEMIKRVLQNTTCSGIYKITCLKTGEIYIGKSTDIKNRWQQHCKSAFNCGTIASSLLHTKMKEYGIENFTFEVLETVPKENLSEREKFYINFYKTKEVGLNERNG